MLLDHCLSVCLSCLSVTLVYCGQTVEWIKMKLGMQVGLDPGHIVLDGDPAPLLQRGTAPQFSAHICCGHMAGWIKMPLGRKVALDPSDIVLDGDHVPPPAKGGRATSFRPMSIVAKRLYGSTCHLVWRVGLGAGHIVLYWDPAPPPLIKGHSPPIFCPCLLWSDGCMDQDATSYVDRPWPRPLCVTWGPSSPQRGTAPYFQPCLLWPNGRPSQLLLSTCYLNCL